MALKDFFDPKWWGKIIYGTKEKEESPKIAPPQPLKPLGQLFYLDFTYKNEQENILTEVTPPADSKIESGTSFHTSVLTTENPIVPSPAPTISLKHEDITTVSTTPVKIPKQEESKEEIEWLQDNPEFIKNSFHEEMWTIPQPHQKEAREKYGYDKPLVIKMTNMLNPNDFKIFVSVKQFCETLSVKPKKVYTSLETENKIFNSKYKLEIIPFPIDEERFTVKSINVTQVSDTEQKIDVNIIPIKATEFLNLDFKILPTGAEFSSGTHLEMRIKNMRKHKFISIADKCPQLVKEWDELNNGVPADKVPHALKESAFWICQLCGTRYERRIDNRTRRPEPCCTKCVTKKSSK